MPSIALSRMLGEELLDNRGARELERITLVTAPDESPAGVMFRFAQTDSSLGFWGRDEDGRSRYSIIGVRFDIVPLNIAISVIQDPAS